MRGKITVDTKGIESYAEQSAETYFHCFDADSTEHWIRIFASKRWDTIKAVQRDDYDNKIPKKYDKVFIDKFTETTLPYIEECKKNRRKRQKEEAEQQQAKRKKGK